MTVRIHTFYSEEDGGYIADAVDLKYCSAFGHSYEVALEEFEVALSLHGKSGGDEMLDAHYSCLERGV